ncbi:hypothetical protein SAY86_030273 [Trapa natans]|uniref:Uncharacterized protein n=1 Tax=Trapa natans TaxID=22666 RepID=A0AAN7MFT5_TRANT|nr:hypothetical protein SAY86_030273 [Trapa natans]
MEIPQIWHFQTKLMALLDSTQLNHLDIFHDDQLHRMIRLFQGLSRPLPWTDTWAEGWNIILNYLLIQLIKKNIHKIGEATSHSTEMNISHDSEDNSTSIGHNVPESSLRKPDTHLR